MKPWRKEQEPKLKKQTLTSNTNSRKTAQYRRMIFQILRGFVVNSKTSQVASGFKFRAFDLSSTDCRQHGKKFKSLGLNF